LEEARFFVEQFVFERNMTERKEGKLRFNNTHRVMLQLGNDALLIGSTRTIR
jgi:hypothetical protein